MEKQPEKRMYPEHLYDKTRRHIAIQLLEKEYSKQLALSGESRAIDVTAWAEQFDEHTFWNAIEGFMGGTLLKPIVHFLTAENYTWSKQDIQVTDIQLSSKLSQLDRLGELDPHELFLATILDRLKDSPDERQQQLEIVASYSKGPDQDRYPVLVVEKDGRPMVMDGNRRCLQVLLKGEETISAWYCQTNNEQPSNFWYPIDDMMRLTRIYNATKDIDPTIKKHMRSVLAVIFSQSNVAETAYRERVVAIGTKGADDLINDNGANTGTAGSGID